MTKPAFDLRALFQALDGERKRQDLSWAALGRQVSVAPSTMRRFGTADDAEADGVLAAIRWLDAMPEDYMEASKIQGVRLRADGYGHVRVDMEKVARANGDPRGANGRTRTTIQTLVAVAERSGQPVASLTRFSKL